MVGRLEAYLVGQIHFSDRPNMSISTNLSVTGRWLQYNGKINNIGRPTLQICCTEQIFFQSTTSRPFCSPSRRDSSVCGIPTIGSLRGVNSPPAPLHPLFLLVSLSLISSGREGPGTPTLLSKGHASAF